MNKHLRVALSLAILFAFACGTLSAADSGRRVIDWLKLLETPLEGTSKKSLLDLTKDNEVARKGVEIVKETILKNPGGSKHIGDHPERFIKQIEAAINEMGGSGKIVDYFENVGKIRNSPKFAQMTEAQFADELEQMVRPLRYGDKNTKGFRGSIAEVSQAAKDSERIATLKHKYPNDNRMGRDYVITIDNVEWSVEVRAFFKTDKYTSLRKARETAASHLKRQFGQSPKIEDLNGNFHIDVRWGLGPNLSVKEVRDAIYEEMKRTVKFKGTSATQQELEVFEKAFAQKVRVSAMDP